MKTLKEKFALAANKAFWMDVLQGLGAAFNPCPPPPRRTWKSDAEALRGDWEAVGGNMREAMRRYTREHGPAPKV